MRRQRLLLLWTRTPDLKSPVGAWSTYDGTGREHHTTGDADTPPYKSVLDAMRDGWRVLQVPVPLPPEPGMELTTSFLKNQFVLEKIVDAETGEEAGE
jgi:hypothetical protein